MNDFSDKPSPRTARWIARIFGTLIGLLLLAAIYEWFSGFRPPTTIRDYLIAVGMVLIILGFAVGWFKELAASLLVLVGTALVFVIELLPPGREWPWPLFVITGFIGLLFLNVHLAGKKK